MWACGSVRGAWPRSKTRLCLARVGGAIIPGTLSAGLIDLQVNGGGSVMVNSAPEPESLRAIAAAHRRFGTTWILPTVITDRAEVMEQAAEAALGVQGEAGQLGLHIEGPHLARTKRGTHDGAYIRPLDAKTIAVVERLRAEQVAVMITLAPEAAAPEQIAELSQMGAIVSLGHTDATAEHIAEAITAGARCGTHLFNAMSQMQGRAPGAVGAILNSDIPFGLICDGHHVAFEMIALALRAAGPDRGFIVSDAMATVGGADHFTLYGKTIAVDGGRLVNAEGNLAGAHVTMAEGLRNLVQQAGVSFEDALRMGLSTPARVIGRPDLAGLIGQKLCDLIVWDDDFKPRPLQKA